DFPSLPQFAKAPDHLQLECVRLVSPGPFVDKMEFAKYEVQEVTVMKCQSCDNQATLHVTEMVNGEPTEFHVCESHLDDLDKLKAAIERQSPGHDPEMAFLFNPEIGKALSDPEAQKKFAAHLLPALCLALLDPKPEVKIIALRHLMMFQQYAPSALGALQDALLDSNENVREAAKLVLKSSEEAEMSS